MSDSSKDLNRVGHLDLIESLVQEGKFREALAEIHKEEIHKDLDEFSCEWGWLCHLAAKSHRGLGSYQQALKWAEKALAVFKTTLENQKLAQIQFNLGVIHSDIGNVRKAELCLGDAASTYRRIDDREGVAKTYNELSRVCFTKGSYQAAVEHLKEALAYCDEIKEQRLTARVTGNLGTVYMIADRWEEAAESLIRSVESNKACKDTCNLSKSYLSLGYSSLLLRRLSEAGDYLKKAYRIICKNGLSREKAIYHEYSGELAFVRGDLTAASEHYLEAIEIGERIAPKSAIISQSYRLLAELQMEKGNLKDAVASCEKSLLASRGEIEERIEEATAYRTLGRIYGRNGHPADVRKNFDRAIRLLEEMGVKFELAKTYLAMAQDDNYTFWEKTKFLGRAEELASRLDTPYYLAKVYQGFAEMFLQENKLGEAQDFLSKARNVFEKLDEKQDLELLSVMERRMEKDPCSDRSVRSADRSADSSFDDIITQDDVILEILERVQQVKDSDISILLEGGTGTGKDLLAKVIHYTSNRKHGRFVVVSCAARPGGLFESELFGHKKGAFTGAVADKNGFVDEAKGGTLYLDEIADVPLSIQVKLLRAIEEKEIVRLGDVKPRKVDFRVIAATNKNLDELVARGEFRNDLFYRLAGIRFNLPPLKERKGDIPLLVEHFLKRYCTNGVSRNCVCDTRLPSSVPSVDPEVMALLVNHDWPGNVRELDNLIKQMFIACKGESRITEKALSGILEKLNNGKPGKDSTLIQKRKQYEKEQIEKALAEANGVKSQAARILGIDEALLRYKIKTLGITYPPKSNGSNQQ